MKKEYKTFPNGQVLETTFGKEMVVKRWLKKKERIKLSADPNLVRCNEGRIKAC